MAKKTGTYDCKFSAVSHKKGKYSLGFTLECTPDQRQEMFDLLLAAKIEATLMADPGGQEDAEGQGQCRSGNPRTPTEGQRRSE